MEMKRRWTTGLLIAVVASVPQAACDEDFGITYVADEPDAPRDLTGSYYNRGVDLSWRLGPDWNGEPFRVYGKRVSDADYFFIAEVTSCIDAVCVYRDINVRAGVTYEYYVAAVDPDTGVETPSEYAVEVRVPEPVPPPVPERLQTVALDGAAYLHWDDSPALEDDFLAYRIYASADDGYYLVGETDSPGFVDLLATNGHTTSYFVTSLDDQGHESDGSEAVDCTPRLDYAGEIMYAHGDVPSASGFRFQESEDAQAVMAGDSEDRHFRLESDRQGLWMVPGPRARIHPESRWTTSLKCGPGADPDCESWEIAPRSGYSTARAALDPGYTYMFRVPGDDGETRFGALRATIIGVDQEGDELTVFDWAFQTQPGNPRLSRTAGTSGG
ncbi:MAG: hypothetical protein F4205_09205 [Gemmatimonadetes bacterium]|nr:hypothetical protein [Gemmatimonadota bacterium]